ncbi:MAG: pyrimidine 5'-nucleotidase [Anaerolineaceae bacterium]|nr:pyrimidine 5'-nucleotidase [Anaerolineaceae bacterium]
MLHTIFFDLDNTIYSRNSGLWEAISGRIDLYIKDILHIQKSKVPAIRQYCRENYGTSLQGLKSLYPIDEAEFLSFVHDIDLSKILYDDGKLAKLLSSISQRKKIFTNSDTAHANRVLDFFGVTVYFDQIIDVVSLKPYVKPQPEAFEKALLLSGLTSPDGCVFLDDMVENVKQGQKSGFLSILVGESNDNILNIPDIYMLPELLKSLE